MICSLEFIFIIGILSFFRYYQNNNVPARSFRWPNGTGVKIYNISGRPYELITVIGWSHETNLITIYIRQAYTPTHTHALTHTHTHIMCDRCTHLLGNIHRRVILLLFFSRLFTLSRFPQKQNGPKNGNELFIKKLSQCRASITQRWHNLSIYTHAYNKKGAPEKKRPRFVGKMEYFWNKINLAHTRPRTHTETSKAFPWRNVPNERVIHDGIYTWY